MITAFPLADGNFAIYADSSSETYVRRNEFKKAGAKWNGSFWRINETQRRILNIEREVRIEIDPCHCKKERTIIFVPESKAKKGESLRYFCMYCDSEQWTKVRKRIRNTIPS